MVCITLPKYAAGVLRLDLNTFIQIYSKYGVTSIQD